MATNNSANTSSGKLTLEKAASDLQLEYIGGTSWCHGLDDDDSDAFKLCTGVALGTNTTFAMSTSGERTLPLQPMFYAYLATTDSDVTGDGTVFQIGSGNAWTESFDIGGDFNTNGIFTAPVAGRYVFGSTIFLLDIGAGHTEVYSYFTVDSVDYEQQRSDAAAYDQGGTLDLGGTLGLACMTYVDMAASDTCILSVVVNNSTKTVDVRGVNQLTRFYGGLIC